MVHLNLNETDALWMQGHLLLYYGLNLVAYLTAPSSFRVLVGGSTISMSLELSVSDIFSLDSNR